MEITLLAPLYNCTNMNNILIEFCSIDDLAKKTENSPEFIVLFPVLYICIHTKASILRSMQYEVPKNRKDQATGAQNGRKF